MLGSVRTVYGGEAYDAVTFMFHDAELVIVCPDPAKTFPLKLTVAHPNPFEEDHDSFSLETRNKVFNTVKKEILLSFNDLKKLAISKLLEERSNRFTSMGVFNELS